MPNVSNMQMELMVKLDDTCTIKSSPMMLARNTSHSFKRYNVQMSLVVRKSVFGVSDQVPHKSGCIVTEDGRKA